MAIPPDVQQWLLREANALSGSAAGQRTPVLKIARAQGVRVLLREDARANACGRLVFGSPPRIIVPRLDLGRSSIELVDDDEDALTQRERFTIAHELGHWLVHREFGIRPEVGGGRGYWSDEKVVNRFAGSLLVPDAMVRSWIARLDASVSVVPPQLEQWARQANASRVVVARRVCEHNDEIGFAALGLVRSARNGVINLRVEFAAAGKNINLPGSNSHVRNRELLRHLRSKDFGRRWLRAFQFVTVSSRFSPQSLELAWARRSVDGPPMQGPEFLTSWRRVESVPTTLPLDS